MENPSGFVSYELLELMLRKKGDELIGLFIQLIGDHARLSKENAELKAKLEPKKD